MNVSEKTFNPNEHLINLGSDRSPRWYLPVQWRLVWLREQYPEAQITTEMEKLDFNEGYAIFKATVKNGSAEAVGHGSETSKDFRDYIEKAETKAIGRALAALGFGTQFAPELDEGQERIADAPTTPKAKPQARKEPTPIQPKPDSDGPATAQQLKTIQKLQQDLGLEPASLDGLSFGDCAQLLKEYSQQLNAKRQAS